jgi:hypothetical protein
MISPPSLEAMRAQIHQRARANPETSSEIVRDVCTEFTREERDDHQLGFQMVIVARERLKQLDEWIDGVNPSGSRAILEEYQRERRAVRELLALHKREQR